MWLVRDEEGLALRAFPTKAEAVAFALEGWTVHRLPPKPKPDLMKLVGECLF